MLNVFVINIEYKDITLFPLYKSFFSIRKYYSEGNPISGNTTSEFAGLPQDYCAGVIQY